MASRKPCLILLLALVLLLASCSSAAPSKFSANIMLRGNATIHSVNHLSPRNWGWFEKLNPKNCFGKCFPKDTGAEPTSTSITPTPTPHPTPAPPSMPYSVGYVTSWTDGFKCMQVEPEQIDASAYTHLHFSFAIIDENGRLGVSKPKEANYLSRLINHVNKNFNSVKVIVAVGGWTFNDPGPTQSRFTDMVATEGSRAIFILSCLEFLKKYGADGIDLDWEYPTSAERGGREGDAANFVALVREMRKAFPSCYSISAAVPVGFSTYYNGYHVADMAEHMDYVVSMTYDMHGTWEYVAGTGGPMGAHTDIRDVRRGIEATINSGVPKEKLLLGLAFYARTFKQLDPNQSDVGSPFVDPQVARADPGKCTNEAGFISFNEVTAMMKESPKSIRVNKFDPNTLSNIIAYGKDQWGSYDNAQTIYERVKIANSLGLGGTAVWAVDLDNEEHELSKAIASARASGSSESFPADSPALTGHFSRSLPDFSSLRFWLPSREGDNK